VLNSGFKTLTKHETKKAKYKTNWICTIMMM